ncbi:carboxypeptidase-like regulatory domain-containing protein [Bizionia gelidisalsuginis]|uniref:Carboxypeptidase-like regulatory domain-containing protein n=1 Tax=Bizionia gelidisalsuginis TaxID=291188 RepID=A0ABY3MDG9_9FLAO|nr:carboxypeptidase-like regulatory domain-containing protein [Bizionia gelidisalsuginis]TYC17051.1 carboxypeptidase-like regulatory domain-containing protein [Bizionia gelidisalsuginis]
MKVQQFKARRNKAIKILFFLFLVVCISSVQAQNIDTIKGEIIDAQTDNPIPLARLQLNISNISTVSNSEGVFTLKYPSEATQNFVTITALGYNKRVITIADLQEDFTTIKLDVSPTVLAQVDINTPNNARNLVKKMLSLKDENYFNNEVIMTGFYRETIKRRNRNASLSEAVVSIYKEPYTSYKQDDITLIKARKQTNYARLDTVALKLQGGPYSALHTDIVKYSEYVFNENNLDSYNFSFEKSTQINNNLVYVVAFKQKENNTDALYYGKLYIDANSFALTRSAFNLNVENRVQATNLFIIKKPRKAVVYPTEAAYVVHYKNDNNKWQFAYSKITLAFKVKWKNRIFNTRYTLQSEMAITNWKDNTAKSTLKNRDKLKTNAILQDEASGFSEPDFWGKYNIIEPDKSIEYAINKINKEQKKE